MRQSMRQGMGQSMRQGMGQSMRQGIGQIMRQRIRQVIVIIAAFVIAFTSLPAMGGGLGAHAAAVKAPAQVKNLKVMSITQTSVKITWSKNKKNLYTKGYAVYRNGKLIKRVSYKTNTFNNTKLKAGTKYKFYVRAYNTYKQRQYYNSKTKKWQLKKPIAKHWKGKKTRNVTKYKYGKASAVKQATTRKPAPKKTSGSNTSSSGSAVKDAKFAGSKLSNKTLYIIGQNSESFYYTVNTSKTGVENAVKWTSSNTNVVKVKRGLWNGTQCELVLGGTGTATITATNWDGQKKSAVVTVKFRAPSEGSTSTPTVTTDPNKAGTFLDSLFGVGLTRNGYGTATNGTKDSSGYTTMNLSFYTDGGETWFKNNYALAVEDVTPIAYKETFSDLGCNNSLSITKMTAEASPDSIDYQRDSITVVKITIKAGPAVRAIKLYDKKGHTIDYFEDYNIYSMYLFPNETDNNDNYWSYDDELYRRMRNKVGASLWTSNMSKYEKLKAVADYINSTTHYPGEITSKEKNPEFWNDWSIDGIDLYYNMSNSPRLNNMMKLQGGITTCVAAYLIGDFAEDLGLEYIYDYNSGVVLDKEGWYIGVGSYSSNPGNPYHYTFYYKDPNGNVKGLDAQGRIGWEGSYDCSQHNCKSNIISMK